MSDTHCQHEYDYTAQESGQVHLYVLLDCLGALSTRLTKRTTSTPKANVRVFSSCSFCPNDTAESLHRAFSDGIGESLIEINLKTQDDQVRTCVSELEGVGDASTLEKYYHRTCLRSAQRTFTPVFHSNVQVIRTVCDEQLLLSIQNTLSDGVTLNMGEVNDVYLLILKRYHAEVDETTNYRKHLKQLNTEYLPNTQFVKSFRKNGKTNQTTLSSKKNS